MVKSGLFSPECKFDDVSICKQRAASISRSLSLAIISALLLNAGEE